MASFPSGPQVMPVLLTRGRFSRNFGSVYACIGRLIELMPKDSEDHLAQSGDVVAKLSDVDIKYTWVMDKAKERKQTKLVVAAAVANAAATGAVPVGGVASGPQHGRICEAIGLKPQHLSYDYGRGY
jgi:hypothetical protein